MEDITSPLNKEKHRAKFLIVRFSSFGDMVQALSIPPWIHHHFPKAEIHWVTLSSFVPLLKANSHLQKVWTLEERQKGSLYALWKLARLLCHENFTHVYDVHNHLRSRILCPILFFHSLFVRRHLLHFLRRPKGILQRFLWLKLHLGSRRQKPFSPQREMLKPLKKWAAAENMKTLGAKEATTGREWDQRTHPLPFEDLIGLEVQEKVHHFLQKKKVPKDFLALAPSASYELKRWPPSYWNQFIASNPQWNFVLLGGKEDTFLEDLCVQEGVWSLAGELSLLESCTVVWRSQLLIANDTGLLHVADQLAKPCIGLLGPSAFGWPSRKNSSHVLTGSLFCLPCSKHGQGPCLHPQYQACLRGILPSTLTQKVQEVLLLHSASSQ